MSALLLGLVTWATAAAEPEQRSAVVAGGEIASSGSSGHFEYRPGVQGTFQPVQGKPLIRLRYRLWTLVGEPVWVFTAKAPRIARIRLRGDDGMPLLTIIRQSNLANGTVRWNKAAGRVTVSADLMDLARVYDFSFQATLAHRSSVTGREALKKLPVSQREDSPYADTVFDSVAVYRAYQGIMGRPGEWGWGVPGSPGWDEAFTHRGMARPSFSRESFQEQRLEAEQAREVMRRLLHAYQSAKRAPFIHLETGDYGLNIHDLMRAIRQAEPEALHAVHGIHSRYDAQLSEIIEAHAEQVRREGVTPALAQERKEIHAVISRHRRRLSAQLLSNWNVLRSQSRSAAADRRAEALLRELAPNVAERLANGQLELPSAVRRELKAASKFFSQEAKLSDGMKTRWQTLKSALDPDAGTQLFAQRYRDNGDGTVTDVVTGLQWTQCTYGTKFVDWKGKNPENGEPYEPNCSGKGKRVYADDLPRRGEIRYAGYSDWRIPSLEELETLIYCRHSDHPDYFLMRDKPAPERPRRFGSCYEVTDHTYRDYTRFAHRSVFDVYIGGDARYLSSTRGTETDSAGGDYPALYFVSFKSGGTFSGDVAYHEKRGEHTSWGKDLYLLLVRDPD